MVNLYVKRNTVCSGNKKPGKAGFSPEMLSESYRLKPSALPPQYDDEPSNVYWM